MENISKLVKEIKIILNHQEKKIFRDH